MNWRTETRDCVACGAQFQPGRYNQVCCSKPCYRQHRLNAWLEEKKRRRKVKRVDKYTDKELTEHMERVWREKFGPQMERYYLSATAPRLGSAAAACAEIAGGW